jgi:glucuronate isomerase
MQRRVRPEEGKCVTVIGESDGRVDNENALSREADDANGAVEPAFRPDDLFDPCYSRWAETCGA